MEYIKNFESFIVKKSYLGQCDRLRLESNENELKWVAMMNDKKKIPFRTFSKNVDASKFLDEESLTSYYNNAKREDEETATYLSHWGDEECMFIQTCGFEFIFV